VAATTVLLAATPTATPSPLPPTTGDLVSAGLAIAFVLVLGAILAIVMLRSIRRGRETLRRVEPPS
jgi:hypothetical protein